MTHRFAFEAVDKSFRDLTGIEKPFGDKVVVLGGDFRQILPVVVRGSRSHIIDACIKSSKLWQDVTVMHLTTNMRVQNEEQKQFVDYLLRIGEGKEPVHGEVGEDMVKLPDEMIINDESIDSLISEISMKSMSLLAILSITLRIGQYSPQKMKMLMLLMKESSKILTRMSALMCSCRRIPLKIEIQSIRIFILWNS